MTNDTQRHGEVAACHALIAHSRLGRRKAESRQAGKSGQISGVNWKTLLAPSASSILLCSHCPGQWESTREGSETHAWVQKTAQPFPNPELVFGCKNNGPRFSLFPISASIIHYSSTVLASPIRQAEELACKWVPLQPPLLWYLQNASPSGQKQSAGIAAFYTEHAATFLPCWCYVSIISRPRQTLALFQPCVGTVILSAFQPRERLQGPLRHWRRSSLQAGVSGREERGEKNPSCDLVLSPMLRARGRHLRRSPLGWSSVRQWWGRSDHPQRKSHPVACRSGRPLPRGRDGGSALGCFCCLRASSPPPLACQLRVPQHV